MEEHKPWTAEQIPDQSGKVVLITGANSGLGYESALALARVGAQVIMACRSLEKGETARREILERARRLRLLYKRLDLSSLSSIREAARQVKGRIPAWIS
jgi:NAD(P)-dependent dehydrogenase (short-subunit alcohol dehydrogenase family)